MSAKTVFGSVSIVGAIIVIIAAIIGWAVLPGVIDGRIEKEVKLESGTDIWDKWTNVQHPIQFKFYIHHVTNPDAVESGELPILEEKGPYVYDETRFKYDQEEKGGSVFYRQNIAYYFNESESAGPDTDTFNVLNVAFVSLLARVNGPYPGLVAGVANLLSNLGHKVIMRDVPVKELTFEGYDVSDYLELPIIGNVLKEVKEYKDGVFGLYYGKNDTDDGFYQINSGKDSAGRFGEIIEWDHKRNLGYWNTWNLTELPGGVNTCDEIAGTDGSIFPPFVDEDRILKAFVVDLCRSVYLTYVGEAEFNDIDGYRFEIPDEMLADPRVNPNNKCFCTKPDLEDCYLSGVLDVTPCRGGPIIMSTPNFLGGDEVYQRNSSLIPDEGMHRTYMIVEPNTGVLLRARKRIQVNIQLTPYAGSPFQDVQELVFPVVWIEESVDISEDSAEDLKDKLKPLKIVNISRWTILGIGIFLAVVGGVLFFVKK